MSYIGKTCPYCKSKITEIDDIVICSSCEMPHHKQCWIENQGCTTFGCNGTIQSPVGQPQTPLNSSIVYCTNCGHPSDRTSGTCIICGAPLVSNVTNSESAYTITGNSNQVSGINPYTSAQPQVNDFNNQQCQNNIYQNTGSQSNLNSNTGYQNTAYGNGSYQNNNYGYNGYGNGNPQNRSHENGGGYQDNGYQGGISGYNGLQGNNNGYNGNTDGGYQNGGYGNYGYQNNGFQGNSYNDNLHDRTIFNTDVANYVQNNAYYYVDKFNRMQGYYKSTTWNWCSFFFSGYWFLYRKMYVMGGAILGIEFLMNFAKPISSIINLLIAVLSGIYGNTTYMKQLDRELEYANTLDVDNKKRYLNEKGGTNTAAVVIAFLLMFLVGIAIVSGGGTYYE